MYASAKITAIIAGGGDLPALLATHIRASGGVPFIIRLMPFCDVDALSEFDGVDARMDKAGAIFAAMRARGAHDVVMIGSVTRPKIWQLRPDFKTLRILPRLLWALVAKGDDALLRAVRCMLEHEGFTLRGMHEYMAELLACKGVMGGHAPGVQGQADIKMGWDAALAHGAADKGQAIVVQRGMILDVEGRDGTDALIARAGQLKVPGGAQPVLVKTVKPHQDWLIDLPTVGIHTIENAFNAGFAGIAIEAGGVLMVDKAAMIARADEYGMFIVGIDNANA